MSKYLPEHLRDSEECRQFLLAINTSYNCYDRDHQMAERAFKISEEEYLQVNEQFKHELGLKKTSIKELQDAIASMNVGEIITDHDNLIDIVHYLKEQVSKRKEAEEKHQDTANRLSFLISNLQSGILVEDEHRKIVITNDTFCKLFDINAPAELLTGMDCSQAAEQSKHMFNQPEIFVARIKEILHEKKLVLNEELRLCDGRFFLRTYIPVFLKDIYKGHLWNYEDVTERKNAESLLKASEELRYFALESSGDAIWEYFPKEDKVVLSERHKEILGLDNNNLITTPIEWVSRLHPDDISIITDLANGYSSGNKSSHQCEYRIKNSQGEYTWILDRGMVMARGNDNVPERVVGTHSNITERKQAEETLQRSEEKYRNIIANMHLGLMELDENGYIKYANQCFCEMSGYSLDELNEKKVTSLFTFGENSTLIEEKKALRKKGVSDAYELAVKNKRGELKWWLVSGAPLYTDNNHLSGSIGIYLDFTDRKKLEFELSQAREEAELSANAKESFLVNMSHEIRTPMNAILGMTSQLTKTSLSKEQENFIQMINTATDHLMVVINDILDMSKIQAGMLNIEKIGFNMQSVVRHAVQSFTTKAEEKKIQLRADVDPAIPPVLIGDPHRLNQIILNLVSNAVKFTDKGGVVITVKLTNKTGDKHYIEIRVMDTGIGMDGEFLEHLFDKFAQEDKSFARKYGGTGLGMAITKQLVVLMDGDIDVQSGKGRGTEFCIKLPFIKGSNLNLPVKGTLNVDKNIFDNKKILLVEDYEMNRLVVHSMLRNFNLDITEAENGQEAIDLLKQQTFDLVLMDVQMPIMSGLEAITIIREQLKLSLPVIALTANAVKGENERCLNAGMSAYISKPFNEIELIEKMAIQLTHNNNDHPDSNGAAGPEEEGLLYSLDKLKMIGNDDTVFIEKMLRLFIEKVPESVGIIIKSWENKDIDGIKAQAHKMKTAIYNLSVTSLQDTVHDLELISAEELQESKVSENIIRLKSIIDKVVEQIKSSVYMQQVK
ncbi:PAS domain S-box protein [Chitinophaga sancti]|uniref:histidine kinase n=1 Tax=Chitinophaga sancti TaxID=1004 RepID=A0A1K1RUD6_9BACT|nr:PAS domain S-box protein [Chitinophaga sancti]WQD62339.1 PAS domain S-box protein [Chitinophaga sancti]WQG92092.1 PAS domain S-box protein [Chitinophaga sancti]SFW75843.1 PAS domain S-box-containing protein [Chitinophaga sancti]